MGAINYFCLFDLAYMLRGTSARFDIREPLDERWDFWIVRGEDFTPTGAEFRPVVEERWATRADGGPLFSWVGFDNYPEQTFIMGIDGADEPAISVPVRTIQDPDNVYFDLRCMGAILGFDALTRSLHFDAPYYLRGFDAVITTETRTPAQLPDYCAILARLLVSLTGHWVDVEHFYSPVLDESVIFPAEIVFSYHGANSPVLDSVAPIHPELSGWQGTAWDEEWQQLWAIERFFWFPVSMSTLENGLVEITVNQPEQPQPAWNFPDWVQVPNLPTRPPSFYNHRIIFCPHENPVSTITLYIGETPHTMRRFDSFMDYTPPRHYQLPPAEGGITFRYIPSSRHAFIDFNATEFRIYRSAAPIERPQNRWYFVNADFHNAELLFRQTGIDATDRIIFEFTDPTPQPGNVYYSIWRVNSWGLENITPNNFIRANVNEIHDKTEHPEEPNALLNLPPPEPETDDPPESPEPDETSSGIPVYIIALVLGFVVAKILIIAGGVKAFKRKSL
jgi:hypothetical protein